MKVRLTKNALDALNAASGCARQLGHDHVGAEHVFLSILSNPSCGACQRLERLDLSIADLAASMRTMIAGETQDVMQRGQLPLTARMKKILDIAATAAGPSRPVETCDLVLAILREGENAAAQLLFNVGVTVETFVAAATQDVGGGAPETGGGEAADDAPASRGANGKAQKTPTVNAYGRDLTELARTGRLDPVVGRDTELRRLVQILSRRTKNNAVLIGEAGVGKTAVVEGLAQAIHRGAVPEKMQGKRVVAVDMVRIVAGTQYRGQFEERLKKLVDETKRAGNIILFLDEIHTMVGAGGAEGAMDAANILKPALARGELQCVGATTLKEYHKSIEKDAALERRFQSVTVEEPTVADAVAILKGVAPRYEAHHAVAFSDAALRAAVELTARYLPARQLPDKAIDAIDETGARLRMGASARPKDLTDRQAAIDALRGEKDEAVREGDFDRAAACRDKIRTATAAFSEALEEWRRTHAETVIGVDEDAVAETVSAMSGVPVEKMDALAAEKLLGMEKALDAAVVGQHPAVEAIARALRRSRAFLADPKRPIGSFLFLGPTGVGKTHLAKMLAERVYGDEKALITLDMSEFQEKYSSSRLVGAPPGYVGYEEGGQLTEKVRRRPYSVVLFDEFEKANADVMNVLLQILDDGRLTDGQGRVVDFRNTIVICTANLGTGPAGASGALGFGAAAAGTEDDAMRGRLLDEARRAFRPELLNRFDETVVFRRLSRENLAEILRLELAKLVARLDALGHSLSLDGKAEAFLVDKGYDPALGARPLRRVVQKYVEDPLAELMLAGRLRPRVRATAAPDGEGLSFSSPARKMARPASLAALALLAAFSFLSPARASTLSFDAGADLRVRQEYSRNAPGLPGGGLLRRTARSGAIHHMRFRPDVWAEISGVTAGEAQWRLRARLVDEFRWNVAPRKHSNTFPDEVIFDTLFLEGKGLWGGLVDMRVGRQSLLDFAGLPRVFVDGTPGDGSRTAYADMATVRFNVSETSALDLFALYDFDDADDFRWGTSRGKHKSLTGLGGGAEPEMDDFGFGAVWSGRLCPALPYQVFAMQKSTRAFTRDGARHPRTRRELVGVRLRPRLDEEWSFDLEGMSQFGRNGADETLSGWSAYAGVEWKSARAGARPFASLGYRFMSGDEDAASEDGGHRAWDPMWARGVNESELFAGGTHYGVSWWSNLHMLLASGGVEWGPRHVLSGHAGPLFAAAKDGLGGGEGAYKGFLAQVKYAFPIRLPDRAAGERLEVVGHLLGECFLPGDYYESDATGFFLRWQIEFRF